LSCEEKAEVDSIPWGQRYGMHESPYLFCIMALLIDVYLMITNNEEGCKVKRFAGVEGFVSQTGQFKSYSEFNRKPM